MIGIRKLASYARNWRCSIVVIAMLAGTLWASAAFVSDALQFQGLGTWIWRAQLSYSPSIPTLNKLRLLSSPNGAGALKLAWSPDGERLATYVYNGPRIGVWSPDGSVYHESPRYAGPGISDLHLLGFLSGHRELLTGPLFAEEAYVKLHRTDPQSYDDIALTVLDAKTLQITRQIHGLYPGHNWQRNIISKIAISPDQKIVAAVYNTTFAPFERRIGLYSVKDWRLLRLLDFDSDDSSVVNALSFCPDGTMLAVAFGDRRHNTQVALVDTATWMVKKKILAFKGEESKQGSGATHVSFNYDSTMIVVAGSHGTFWQYDPLRSAPKGKGMRVVQPPIDPIRVFKVSDGTTVNSAKEIFTGGPVAADEISWSPRRNLIAFLDLDGELFLWDPQAGGYPKPVRGPEYAMMSIAFSPDGRLLGQSSDKGVWLFAINE